jgi:hypothetical protein
MKKILLLGAIALMGCTQGQSKYNAANTAANGFLQACIYQSIDYQITGDNTSKTYTVHCAVRSNLTMNN